MKSSKCTHCWWQGKFQKIDGFKKSTFLRKKPTTNPKLITEPPYKNPSQSFPCWRFQVLLTLFSEFFASFPRGTCLLSVSHQIFSLRWSLPPALGCTLKQPDSEEWKYVLVDQLKKNYDHLRDYHPLWCSVPRDFDHSDHTRNATLIRLQFGCRCYLHQILGLGLFPLHSQLLWESLLVSFPPLNDMLKFRG